MGACYYIEMKLFKKDSAQCESALKKCLKDAKIEHKGLSFDELLETVLCAKSEGSKYEKHDGNHYSSAFDASYMWESVVHNAFFAMAPHLLDGSMAYIEPDNDYYMLVMKNGRCIDTRCAKVRNLQKEDLSIVLKLDEMSDFDIVQWLEDLEENDKADNCFGIFYDEELIGYCTLGYASGAIDIETKCDDVLLSDVYIKEEWRHMRLGTKLIREVTENLEDDCYLTYLCDDLEDFYHSFEFNKVEGTENVMVRYA